jgi:tRNA-2-methylthio-N6-dimethylallyladenosine synthase
VLVEGTDKGGSLWSGRSERNEIVHVAGAADRDLAGELVEVAIVRHNKHSLQGELTASARAGSRPLGIAASPKPARRALPIAAGA